MIKKIYLLAFFTLIVHQFAFSQEFTLQSAGLLNVGRSSQAWGDYDTDGDLDLLLSGDPVSAPYVLKIYHNDAGTFTDIDANLTGIYNSAVTWGDFDNDGDLDILATGRSASNSKTWLYRNKNGEFVAVNAGLPDIGSDGAVAWGDYDGDGDLDALIAGNYSCRIFNNDAGTFTDINAGLPPVSNCWVDWGDYDNDGDQDVFVMGDMGGILTSSIFRNDKSTFTEVPADILPMCAGSASWCDADNDLDLDLIVCGFDEYLEPNTLIYQNLGEMQFLCMIPDMVKTALGTACWGDYDNDGDADVLLTGQNPACGSLSSHVYRNDGGFFFTDINANLAGTERGAAAWGDYDNDGDLDIVISGISGSGSPVTALYRNNMGSNTFQPNLPPEIPAGLVSTVSAHHVSLNWNHVTDNNTPASAVNYNLRIGKVPGGNDVMPAMSSADGTRLVTMPGNMTNDTAWSLSLPDGTYYWSVQALDHSFAGSQFAGEQQFTVLNVSTGKPQSTVCLTANNPFKDQLIVQSQKNCSVEVRDSNGRLTGRSVNHSKFHQFDTSCWQTGVYFIKSSAGNEEFVLKVVKSH